LQLFNQGVAEDGTIDITKKVSPQTAVKLLKAKVTTDGWDKSNILTEQQIRSLFSRHKNDRTKRGHKAMQAIEVNNIVKEVVKLSYDKPVVNNIVKEVVKLSYEKPTLIEEKEKTKKRNVEVAGIENK